MPCGFHSVFTDFKQSKLHKSKYPVCGSSGMDLVVCRRSSWIFVFTEILLVFLCHVDLMLS